MKVQANNHVCIFRKTKNGGYKPFHFDMQCDSSRYLELDSLFLHLLFRKRSHYGQNNLEIFPTELYYSVGLCLFFCIIHELPFSSAK